jgi:hypothetical protein
MSVQRTLNFSLGLTVSNLFNGATRNVIDPGLAEDLNIASDPGYTEIIVGANVTGVNIRPPHLAEGDQLIICPEYEGTAPTRSMLLKYVVGVTTHNVPFSMLAGILIPASLVTMTVDNLDTSNSVVLRIVHFRRA